MRGIDDLRNFAKDPKLIKRAWSRVSKRSGNECWPWIGLIGVNGYGRFPLPGRRGTSAHRFIWATLHDAPDPGLHVCHKCDNRICCNPKHLFLGTPTENVLDMKVKGRIAHNKGMRNGMAKLTDTEVLHIRASDMSAKEMARVYGVADTLIWKIRRRLNWKHI